MRGCELDSFTSAAERHNCPDGWRASNPDRLEAQIAYWVWTGLSLRYGPPTEKFAIQYVLAHHPTVR